MAERRVRAGEVCPACGRGLLGLAALLLLAAIIAGRIMVEALVAS